MEAEIGGMQPRAKECLEPPEAREAEARKESPSEPAEGGLLCQSLDLGLYLQTVRESISDVLSHQVCDHLFWQP